MMERLEMADPSLCLQDLVSNVSTSVASSALDHHHHSVTSHMHHDGSSSMLGHHHHHLHHHDSHHHPVPCPPTVLHPEPLEKLKRGKTKQFIDLIVLILNLGGQGTKKVVIPAPGKSGPFSNKTK